MHYSLITFVTKYSRVPQEEIACINYNAKIEAGAKPIIIEYEAYETILKSFNIKCKTFGLRVLACNIIPDHIHLLLGHKNSEISKDLHKIKGHSAFMYNNRFKNTTTGGGRQNTLRAKGYSKTKITSKDHLKNTIKYINRNQYKHAEKRGNSLIENYEIHLKKKLVEYNRLL